MTPKERLQTILSGQVPDFPPHFEMVFQLEKEMFGMNRKSVECRIFASEAKKKEALMAFDITLNSTFAVF